MGKRKATQASTRRKPIPVTLLSGFLGAGKTTLLNHLLENTSSMKIVVIVNDMSVVNIDAKLVKRSSEKLIELSNGCICCTLREDLLDQLLELGKKSDADAIVIESTGISEPIHVAETFAHSKTAGKDLESLVSLDTMVTVVDAKHFFAYFKGVKCPSAMLAELKTCPTTPGDSAVAAVNSAEDSRTLVDLLIDQVQFADIILLNKIDCISESEKSDVLAILHDLNPHAKVLHSTYGRIAPTEIINTNLFSFEKAEQHADWFVEEWGTSTPESEEYGISSFVYESRRPFHPDRLFETLAHTKDLVSSASKELADKKNKKLKPSDTAGDAKHPVSALIRCKGFVWFSTRNDHYVQLHVAGGAVHVTRGGPWWADVPRKQWPKDPAFKKEVLSTWNKPFGDRAQTLVCIGLHMNEAKITAALDACLLSDAEMKSGMDSWAEKVSDNLFPSTEEEEESPADHDHNHADDHLVDEPDTTKNNVEHDEEEVLTTVRETRSQKKRRKA